MVTTLTVDCFGAKHFATNYGAVDLAPSLGSYIWASRVAVMLQPTTTDRLDLDIVVH
eukprot:COSAG06_NODE_2118_length_7555_cov_2.285542_5_plen_57_part_00